MRGKGGIRVSGTRRGGDREEKDSGFGVQDGKREL
jgi:hypothetical protein